MFGRKHDRTPPPVKGQDWIIGFVWREAVKANAGLEEARPSALPC
jgi:hypothetical protein